MMERKHFKAVLILAAALLAGDLCLAQGSLQVPPDVEAQAKTLEAKFNSVLDEECGHSLCTPVGCEVGAFRTLDEKQNSSLPGLDESDETPTGPLQYKLSSLRCEFAYEPSLTNEAVTSLRQRVAEKVRIAGVSLNITGRKLNPLNAKLREAPKPQPAAAATPAQTGLLIVSIILALTFAALALIWAVRRLGKPRELVESAEGEEASVVAGAAAGPNAFALIEKKERLQVALADPRLAADALQPLVKKGDVEQVCRVLKHFGPAPLVSFVDKPENRDFFTSVHEMYEKDGGTESSAETWEFLEKIERLVTLAQLGRPQNGIQEELEFLSSLDGEEFSDLAQGLSHDELMALLSFVPLRLRAHYLQSCDEAKVEEYAQHILKYPRISEQAMRRLAATLKARYQAKHSEIKKVTRDQVRQLEQLMNTLDGARRNQLIQRVRQQTPDLMRRLTCEVLLDAALVKASDSVLNELFLALSPTEAATYLQAHPQRDEILAKLKGSLSQSLANRLKMRAEKLDFLNDSPELIQARAKVNEFMKSKSAHGEINLRELNEQVVEGV